MARNGLFYWLYDCLRPNPPPRNERTLRYDYDADTAVHRFRCATAGSRQPASATVAARQAVGHLSRNWSPAWRQNAAKRISKLCDGCSNHIGLISVRHAATAAAAVVALQTSAVTDR